MPEIQSTKQRKAGRSDAGSPLISHSGRDFPMAMDNYEGRAGGGSILIGDGEVLRLPDQPCRYAMLSHWNVLNNANFSFRAVSGDQMYENAGNEIYYGFNGTLCLQLFPSQNTGLLPINNLNQICVRTRTGNSATLWFAWFF